jgi:hypothetical protein
MGIANFSELRTQIASWVNRTDLSTAQLSLFVAAAESDIRNDLETREGWQSTSGTVTSNTITVPSGFLSVRTLTVDDFVLDYLPQSTLLSKDQEGYVSGYYTIENDTITVLGGTNYVLHYIGSLTSLSGDSDTNWLLENAPNVYLWAGCKYASVFLRDIEGATGFGTLYAQAVSQLNARETRGKHGSNLMVRVA